MSTELKSYSEYLKQTQGPCFPNYSQVKHFDMRGLLDYAKKKGVKPLDLTKREFDSFYHMR